MTGHITTTINLDLAIRFRDYIKKDGRSQPAILEEALQQYLDNADKKAGQNESKKPKQ